ncbi:MAG TPA: hypothetical protein VMF89_29005 [Polyangiales bacterium]|nr:hypothetical protein [Polyangiales bacterium]
MRERNTETSPRFHDLRRRAPVSAAERALQLALCALLLCSSGFASAQVQAQVTESSPMPRMLTLISGGAPLRLTVDRELGQERMGPLFGNVMLGYVLPGGRLQHGFGVSASWNATHDGGYTTPVYAFDQVAVMPAYLAYYHLSPDVFGIGHLGVPILARGGPSAGVQVGAALAYRVFAGTGLFAGIDLSSHIARGFNLFASLELGVVIDYEVLP